MKKITAALLVLALALALCSCAPRKPADFLKRMDKALAETPCSRELLVTTAEYVLDGVSLAYVSSSDITVTEEPAASFTDVTVSETGGSEPSVNTAQVYAVAGTDGTLVRYTRSGSAWLKQETGQDPSSLALSAALSAADPAAVTLDGSALDFEGVPAICLCAELGPALAAGVLNNVILSTAGADTADAVDYAALGCTGRLYLDAATFLPVAEVLDLTGLAEALAPVTEILSVDRCRVERRFTSFEPAEEILLPDRIEEKVELWERLLTGDPDNGDGTFTIREGGAIADITAPFGYSLSKKSYDSITFVREDRRSVTYTMYYLEPDDTLGEYFTELVDSVEDRYEWGGGDVSREQLSVPAASLTYTADIMGVVWGTREDAEIYAWSRILREETGNYFLLVKVADGYNDGFGNYKTADITPEEWQALLDAASPNGLMD